MLRFIGVLVLVVLMVYAFVDCARLPSRETPYLPKALWLLLIVLVPLAGPIGWLVMSRGDDSARSQPGRPLAPDDDPDFLWRLNRKRRDDDSGSGAQPTN